MNTFTFREDITVIHLTWKLSKYTDMLTLVNTDMLKYDFQILYLLKKNNDCPWKLHSWNYFKPYSISTWKWLGGDFEFGQTVPCNIPWLSRIKDKMWIENVGRDCTFIHPLHPNGYFRMVQVRKTIIIYPIQT